MNMKLENYNKYCKMKDCIYQPYGDKGFVKRTGHMTSAIPRECQQCRFFVRGLNNYKQRGSN